jgi:hypothetical protein
VRRTIRSSRLDRVRIELDAQPGAFREVGHPVGVGSDRGHHAVLPGFAGVGLHEADARWDFEVIETEAFDRKETAERVRAWVLRSLRHLEG